MSPQANIASPSPVGILLEGLDDSSVAHLLLEEGGLSEQALHNARQVQATASTATTLLAVLLRTAAVPEQPTLALLAQHLQVPLWGRERLRALAGRVQSGGTTLGLSTGWCRDQRVAFVAGASQSSNPNPNPIEPWTLILAGAPSDLLRELLTQLVRRWPNAWTTALVTPSDFLAALDPADASDTQFGGELDLKHLKELAEEGPIIELVNSMLSRAVSLRASDVHLEPLEQGFVVRLRVDGRMRELERFNAVPYEAVVCRVKILSAMDIAERRLPQDGRLDARVNGISFDVRVSVIPMVRGESVVLRLLRQERMPSSLNDLGMSTQESQVLQRWLTLPNGLILVTGPTGSGKSTTLYTAIDLLGKKTDKIVTVEDPVEYKLPGVSQIQVNSEIGLDFPQALRSILRHDPDVILVGEIRDGLTAQIATQAALTGHLVLSTLHTNTAAGAVTRLLDMGVDAYLLADSLKGVMAQRLVRRLCPACKQPAADLPAALQARLGHVGVTPDLVRPMRAVGCEQCANSGFLGRVGIHDPISFDDTLARLIRPGVTASEIEQFAHQQRNTVPWTDGWRKVASGETTADEILANTSEAMSTALGEGPN